LEKLDKKLKHVGGGGGETRSARRNDFSPIQSAVRQAGYRVDDDLSEFSRFALMAVVVKKEVGSKDRPQELSSPAILCHRHRQTMKRRRRRKEKL
jgi:hypothetical protein